MSGAQKKSGEFTPLGQFLIGTFGDIRSVIISAITVTLFGVGGLVWSLRSVPLEIGNLFAFEYNQHGVPFLLVCLSVVLLALVVMQWFGWVSAPGIGRWVRAVRSVMSRPPDGSARKMAVAFAKTYAGEEAIHVRGRHRSSRFGRVRDVVVRLLYRTAAEDLPGPRVYTSFVSYSALVKSVVETAVKSRRRKHDELVCFTTLKMPLAQWFNNKADTGASFRYAGNDAEWSKYLEFMNEIARHKKPYTAVSVIRVLQIFTGTQRQETLQPKEEMKKYCNARILIAADAVSVDGWHAPFRTGEIRSIISSISDSTFKKNLEACYANRKSAYIIVEDEAPPQIAGHSWMRVADAFERFFAPPEHAHASAYAHLINDALYDQVFKGEGGAPEDVFLVGAKKTNPGRIEWLFCLAATTDFNSQMVRLDFSKLTGDLPPRVQRSVDQANQIYGTIERAGRSDHIKPLCDWLNS